MSRSVAIWRALGAGALALSFVAAAASAGCGHDTIIVDHLGGDGSAPGSASNTVGPAGGIVRLGQASITIPPGALSKPTTIGLATTATPPPPAYKAFSLVYEFSPAGLTFALPATVSLPDEGAPSSSAVYWSKPDGGYQRLATAEASGLATAKVTHFSTGFVGEESAITDGGTDAFEGAPPDGPTDAPPEGPIVLAAKQEDPMGIALSATTVYWAEPGVTDAVVSAPIGGGKVTTLATGQQFVSWVAVDDVHVYWATNEAIVSLPLSGGTPTTLYAGQASPSGLVTDGVNLYWANYNGGEIMSGPVDGMDSSTPLVTLASGQNMPYRLALDSAHVYWTNESSGGEVMSATLSGASLTTLAAGQDYPYGIAVDSENVYFTTAMSTGSVNSVPIGGGTVTTLTSGLGATAIAQNGGQLFWVCTSVSIKDQGGVLSMPTSGGTITTLAIHQSDPYSIAATTSDVFWSDLSDVDAGGSVLELPR